MAIIVSTSIKFFMFLVLLFLSLFDNPVAWGRGTQSAKTDFASAAQSAVSNACDIATVKRLNVSKGVLITFGNCRVQHNNQWHILRKLRVIEDSQEAIAQLMMLASSALVNERKVKVLMAQAHLSCHKQFRNCEAHGYDAFTLLRD